MLRSVLFIKTAIEICQPTMSESLSTTYATKLQAEAQARNYDPITPVAIIDNESKWNSRLVGGLNNQCIGLGQHCLHVYDYCTGTAYRGARCQAKKQWLLNGHNNLMATSKAITDWRKTCRSITGKPALFYRWLHGYQGFGKYDKKRKKWIVVCGMRPTKKGWVDVKRPKLVNKVMRRRIELIKLTERKLRRRRRG